MTIYTGFTVHVYLLFSCRYVVCMRGQNGDNLRLAGTHTLSQNRYGEFTEYSRETTMTTVSDFDGVRLSRFH